MHQKNILYVKNGLLYIRQIRKIRQICQICVTLAKLTFRESVESSQNGSANVGESGETLQNSSVNVGESGESCIFPKTAILASASTPQKHIFLGSTRICKICARVMMA